jgi:hypothetical protein
MNYPSVPSIIFFFFCLYFIILFIIVVVIGIGTNYCTANFWKDKNNRKRFFDLAASRLGFSYKDAKEWYYLTSRDILKFRVRYGRKGRIKREGRDIY